MDRYLAQALPDLSRTRLAQLVRHGHVSVAGEKINEPSKSVQDGDWIQVTMPRAEPSELTPEPLALDVLYEDDDLLILVKDAGVVVHPAPGHRTGTLVHGLLHHCRGQLSGIGGVERPGIVHRLDKDVSGVMVVAKHDGAHRSLSAQFTVHSVERVYEALVFGRPPEHKMIEGAIGRHPKDRKRMAIVARGGKPARTHLRRIAVAEGDIARVSCRLETGRTHQIRVHLTSIGHPILGDPVYRSRRQPKVTEAVVKRIAAAERIFLHARTLGFRHPVSGEAMRFERAPPASFDQLMVMAAATDGSEKTVDIPDRDERA
ncbi:MAG: RluA family pseudouridine synthase [Geminicoccaceae bacterium]